MDRPPHNPSELLAQLEAFDIDQGSVTLSFPKRLARENSWSVEFSERVVGEYKRFVVLCVCAGHPCTPSEHVDQAWHLHMVYTRSYWEAMCEEILGAPLHHGPTRGGELENEKFEDWYARTLESYRVMFGAEPPADIWRPASSRFGHDLRWKRVMLDDHWVVCKPRAVAWWAAGSMVLCGAVLAGCAAGVGKAMSDAGIWLGLVALGLVVAVVGAGVRVLIDRSWGLGVRPRQTFGWGLLAGGGAALVVLLLDRCQMPSLGIPQRVNDPAMWVFGVSAGIGLLLNLDEFGRGSGGGCGSAGGFGGCSGGGCGGGGCGGGCGS